MQHADFHCRNWKSQTTTQQRSIYGPWLLIGISTILLNDQVLVWFHRFFPIPSLCMIDGFCGQFHCPLTVKNLHILHKYLLNWADQKMTLWIIRLPENVWSLFKLFWSMSASNVSERIRSKMGLAFPKRYILVSSQFGYEQGYTMTSLIYFFIA